MSSALLLFNCYSFSSLNIHASTDYDFIQFDFWFNVVLFLCNFNSNAPVLTSNVSSFSCSLLMIIVEYL